MLVLCVRRHVLVRVAALQVFPCPDRREELHDDVSRGLGLGSLWEELHGLSVFRTSCLPNSHRHVAVEMTVGAELYSSCSLGMPHFNNMSTASFPIECQ